MWDNDGQHGNGGLKWNGVRSSIVGRTGVGIGIVRGNRDGMKMNEGKGLKEFTWGI